VRGDGSRQEPNEVRIWTRGRSFCLTTDIAIRLAVPSR